MTAFTSFLESHRDQGLAMCPSGRHAYRYAWWATSVPETCGRCADEAMVEIGVRFTAQADRGTGLRVLRSTADWTMRLTHPVLPKDYRCDPCHRAFKTGRGLAYHVTVQHRQKEPA